MNQMDDTPKLLDSLGEALDRIEAAGIAGGTLTGVPTGFVELDALTNGLQPGSLIAVGARPALGKTTFLLDVCRSATLKHSLPSALFSLEMTSPELVMRLLSAEARVPLHLLRCGRMDDDDWHRLTKRMTEIEDAPLYIRSAGTLTGQALRDEAAHLVRTYGVRLIAVDHLQLIAPEVRGETRAREVGEIARQLRELALDLNVPVVVTAQLNRDPEHRADKKPLLADLGESDVIAQVADLVILLHREEAYNWHSPRAGEADLIVAKNQHGPACTITVAFQGHYARFVDIVQP